MNLHFKILSNIFKMILISVRKYFVYFMIVSTTQIQTILYLDNANTFVNVSNCKAQKKKAQSDPIPASARENAAATTQA